MKIKTNHNNFNLNDLKDDITLLDQSESDVWEAHERGDIITLFDLIKERNMFNEDLIQIYINSHSHLEDIKNEIIGRYPLVKTITFNNNFHEISTTLNILLELTTMQFDKLNISENLLKKKNRISILNGEKEIETQSQFTSLTQRLHQYINSIEGLNLEIPESNKNITNVSEIEELDQINEIAEELIEEENSKEIENEIPTIEEEIEKSEIEEEIPQTQLDEVEIEQIIEEVKQIDEIAEELVEEENYPEIKEEIEKPKSFIIEKEKEVATEEVEDIITTYFSYQDSPNLTSEEKQEIIKRSIKNQSAIKYAKILLKLQEKDELENYYMLSKSLFTRTFKLLSEFEIEPSQYSQSISWSMWDIAKQLYYLENPKKSNGNYILADPLEDEDKQEEIINRHIGWILTENIYNGNVDLLLNKIKNSSYTKKIIDYIIVRTNDETRSVSSHELATLGKEVLFAYNENN